MSGVRQTMAKKIISASLGNCVHAISLFKFMGLGEELGYESEYIGPATPINSLMEILAQSEAEIVAIGYRLTPNVLETLLEELKTCIYNENLKSKKYVFIGTPSTSNVAKKFGIFDAIFNGNETIDDVVSFLKGNVSTDLQRVPSANLIERINLKYPFPLIRHHFGLPSLEETIKGTKELAESKVLDILSIGTDQNAQECFFRPNEMDKSLDGSGGVPVRKPGDLKEIYEASRCGNYPLVRCYSGTRDLIKWADVLERTISNAWGAVPLCWYSQLDGRSKRTLLEAITENQCAVKWYAEHNIPVEVNESHQWALRYTSDTIEVAMAYIASYNAKKLGVKHYVMQYMFNTPPLISSEMDLAKMLAKIDLVESLHDDYFISYRMVRTGLASLSPIPDIAKGQLASSITMAMLLHPHIVHVVGYSEADHAIKPKEIIESCNIIRGVIANNLQGMIDVASVPSINRRKDELLRDASVLLAAINFMGRNKFNAIDPLADPITLSKAVKIGLLDAPLLKGNKCAKGELITKIINGANYAIDPNTKMPLYEEDRIKKILTLVG